MDSLTDVPGIRVGHASVPGGGSGCTVVLGPFLARAEVRGTATGTREMETLRGEHLVPRADAILLTGGSAFGLAAADGAMSWLAERGIGHETGVGPVPIVPAAVLFDLAPDREMPGPGEGWAACDGAGTGPVPQGPVGAGSGATVGKLLGLERRSPGGLGSASSEVMGWKVGALAAVNALGDVVDREGRVVAGAREGDGFLDGAARLLEIGRKGEMADLGRSEEGPRAGENTTLAVVATDAPLSGNDLERVLRVAGTALSRRINPTPPPFDGDVVFGVCTGEGEWRDEGERAGSLSSGELMTLGLAAREALETAILRAVTEGREGA